MIENNCYTCKHRGTVPGDAHSCCEHPVLQENLFLVSMGFMAGVPIPGFNIQAAAHGISSGWFCWPINFDPVWLDRCDMFTPTADPASSCTAGVAE